MLKIVILLSFVIFSQFVRPDDIIQSSKALYDVAHELFIAKNVIFDVVIYGDLSSRVEKVLNEFLKSVQNDQTVLVRHNRQAYVYMKNRPAVIFSDFKVMSLQHLCYLLQEENKGFPYAKTTITYVDNGYMTLNAMAGLPIVVNGHTGLYAYFVVNHGKEIKLKTFEWWTPVACNVTQLVVLNTFKKVTSSWQSKLEIKDKFMNFHGCVLRYLY
jgi:hypothetical protein